MKARVYLRGDEAKKLEGYETAPACDRICGLFIGASSKGFYVELDFEFDVPEPLSGIVDEITLRSQINVDASGRNFRERGEYRLHDSPAVAVVDGSDRVLGVSISKAETMKQVRDLYTAIRIGSIRPLISYDGRQEGLSKQDMENETENFQRLVAEKDEEIVDLKSAVADQKQAVEDLRLEMERLKLNSSELQKFYEALLKKTIELLKGARNNIQGKLCFIRNKKFLIDMYDGHIKELTCELVSNEMKSK